MSDGRRMHFEQPIEDSIDSSTNWELCPGRASLACIHITYGGNTSACKLHQGQIGHVTAAPFLLLMLPLQNANAFLS